MTVHEINPVKASEKILSEWRPTTSHWFSAEKLRIHSPSWLITYKPDMTSYGIRTDCQACTYNSVVFQLLWFRLMQFLCLTLPSCYGVSYDLKWLNRNTLSGIEMPRMDRAQMNSAKFYCYFNAWQFEVYHVKFGRARPVCQSDCQLWLRGDPHDKPFDAAWLRVRCPTSCANLARNSQR